MVMAVPILQLPHMEDWWMIDIDIIKRETTGKYYEAKKVAYFNNSLSGQFSIHQSKNSPSAAKYI